MEEVKASNFIEDIINKDLANGKVTEIYTRFPPEPNGYLHIGHAKSLCLNFGIKQKYNGKCNLRFDDTNPVKEDEEYVESIKEDIKWLGFDWDKLLYASDYFQQMFDFAVKLIKKIESTLRFGNSTSDEDRIQIVLACYNAGTGHILDARRLAVKQGVNHNSWAQLREYVVLKGTPEWVDDEAVRNGAFNGTETVQFVDKVMVQYSKYCKNYI